MTLICLSLRGRNQHKVARSYIILQGIGQFLSEMNWISGFPPLQAPLPASICRVIGSLSTYGLVLMCTQTLALAVHIFQTKRQLKVPSRWGYCSHVASQVVSVGFFLFALLAPPSSEENGFKTCYPTFPLFRLSVALTGILSLLSSLGFALYSRRSLHRSVKWLHVQLVLAYIVCFTPLLVLDFADKCGATVSTDLVLV